MGNSKIMKYHVKQSSRTSSKEDRLSSLPDAILTDILSRLPTNSAAATSVLSHRWRHLWTGITRIKLDELESTALIDTILQKLTSQKLHEFALDVGDPSDVSEFNATESWFREVCSRNVGIIEITAKDFFSVWLPAFLFNSEYLVTLKLLGRFVWPEIEDLSIHLPNLKKLTLQVRDENVPLWLETLISSSPLIEYLNLFVTLEPELESDDPDRSSSILSIITPNLKSLSICMRSIFRRIRVSIDAPKLANLLIRDFCSVYNFLRIPTTLVNAHIDLSYAEEYDPGLSEDYICQMKKFVGGMSSVCDLELKLGSATNILANRNSVNLPILSNLTRLLLETNCFKDLLFSLHYFPNLEHLEASLCLLPSYTLVMEQRSWCAPDSVPDCLVSKLKTIHISGLKGVENDLRLLGYMLSNALVLRKLVVGSGAAHVKVEKENRAVQKECQCQFCRSLLKLPMSSSTCEVVSGWHIRASGITRFLTCSTSCGHTDLIYCLDCSPKASFKLMGWRLGCTEY